MWESQREALAGHDVRAPDLYGLGRTMEDWARAVLAQVEGELAVVGASMGGYCALEVARQAPDRITHLALVGARADADSQERREGREATIDRIRTTGVEGLWEYMRERLFSDAADPDVLERARLMALDHSADELIAAVEAIRDRRDSTELVRSAEFPVLIAVGDPDPFFPSEEAAALAESAPSAGLHVFERCGHLPNLERADDFNRVLTGFLS